MEKIECQSPLAGKMSSAQLRKIKKPIIEKRRRERINDSLNQLKSLVLDAMQKDESRYSKMEKADILELTVHHLKNVHRQQNMQTDSHNLNQKFTAGFSECANEVAQFLNSLDCLTPELRLRIMTHLSQSLQKSAQRASSNNIQTTTAVLATPAFPAVSPAVAAPITSLPCATPVTALPGSTETRYPASISPLSLITSSSLPVALPSGVILIQPSQISPSSSSASMSPSGFSSGSSPSHSSSSMTSSVYSPSSVSTVSPTSSVSGAIPLYVSPDTRFSPTRPFHDQVSNRSSTSPSLADDAPSSFYDSRVLRDTVITTNSVSSCKAEARAGCVAGQMVSTSNASMWRPW